jgi:hypothetical protein
MIPLTTAALRRISTAASIMGTVALATTPALAHEEGAPFADAIIDPLVLHHAHIENEQRVNLFGSLGVPDGAGRKRTAYTGELELAYALPNFRYGVELFVTFATIPSPSSAGRETGLGDIEFRPVKLALYNSSEFIISTAAAVGIPTGDAQRGLGTGDWRGTLFLFSDYARGNAYIGTNLALEMNLSGQRSSAMEYGVAVAYSLIRKTVESPFETPARGQSWVLSGSLEIVGDRGFQAAVGAHSIAAVPGVTLWHLGTGWQLHAGVEVPVSGPHDADATLLVQVGSHFNWGRLLGARRPQE